MFSGARVRAIRERLGVTQAELGNLFGAPTYHFVQQRESGRKNIRPPEAQLWEALERALQRHRPIKVWGPASLQPVERLTRILVLSCDHPQAFQDLAP